MAVLNDENFNFLEGNMTKDPVYRNTPSGTLICNFTIANNRQYKSGEEKKHETSFIDIEAWSKQAENCQVFGKKGRFCRIKGRLKQERWVTPEGAKRSKLIVIAEKIEFGADKEKKQGEDE